MRRHDSPSRTAARLVSVVIRLHDETIRSLQFATVYVLLDHCSVHTIAECEVAWRSGLLGQLRCQSYYWRRGIVACRCFVKRPTSLFEDHGAEDRGHGWAEAEQNQQLVFPDSGART